MLSPHRITDAGTISHNILYFRPHKQKRVVVMTPERGDVAANRPFRARDMWPLHFITTLLCHIIDLHDGRGQFRVIVTRNAIVTPCEIPYKIHGYIVRMYDYVLRFPT